MTYSLNSLKGGDIGVYIGVYYTTMGVIKGGTRNLDNGSYTNIFQRALRANPGLQGKGLVLDLRLSSLRCRMRALQDLKFRASVGESLS